MMLHEEQNLMIPDEMTSDPKPQAGFHINGSVTSDEPNGESTTDRSSASPSNADDLMEDDVHRAEKEEEEEDDVEMEQEQASNVDSRLKGIESKFVYIQHQLSRIMRHIHVTPCICQPCSDVQKSVENAHQLNDPHQMLTQLFPNASEQQLQTLLDLSKMNKLPSQVVTQREAAASAAPPPSQPLSSATNTISNQAAAPPPLMRLGSGYSATNGGGKMASEPRKTTIADFAKMHANSQKKFSFTQPASSFYQRKDSNNSLLTTPITPMPSNIATANSAAASPGPSSDGGDREDSGADQNQEHFGVSSQSVPNTPSLASPMFTQSMVDMLKMNANAAHSSGSPGFLRGRGRGRPKLIGDELDADLVDYMVQIKQNDLHGHMTASQALHIAKQYILERAPGLLEEHGGHVKLKLTWAMKLVTRIGERQKEVELGLPAGTLSNMGRNLNNLPGGNFMADMMAQNIISQHMLMVNQMSSNDSKPPKLEQNAVDNRSNHHHNEENIKTGVANAPEIVNIKELNLPFLTNFLAELNEKNGAIIDGEIGANDA